MGNREHDDAIVLLVDAEEDTPFTDTKSRLAGKRARQSFDVVVPARINFKLFEAFCELGRKWLISGRKKGLRFWREDHLKHLDRTLRQFTPLPDAIAFSASASRRGSGGRVKK
jgi:hypothetical protein